MNLDEGQKRTVASWLEEGMKLSEIQNRLADEFGIRMTYMEVKLLLGELDLQPKDQEQAPEPKAPDLTPATPAANEPPPTPQPGAGKVSVSVDQITRPGALASGKVTFSDNVSAEWSLDQFGRLGLSASNPGYKPAQDDLMEFQTELQNQLAKLGY